MVIAFAPHPRASLETIVRVLVIKSCPSTICASALAQPQIWVTTAVAALVTTSLDPRVFANALADAFQGLLALVSAQETKWPLAISAHALQVVWLLETSANVLEIKSKAMVNVHVPLAKWPSATSAFVLLTKSSLVLSALPRRPVESARFSRMKLACRLRVPLDRRFLAASVLLVIVSLDSPFPLKVFANLFNVALDRNLLATTAELSFVLQAMHSWDPIVSLSKYTTP